MPDSPHKSAPMVMHGRALALKNTCRNASSTSVEKHLSWSPDIHPTARWVPSTPHRARPAGHPPTRHPGAVGAKEREYDEGCDVAADGKRRRPQNTARRRRSVGQLRRPAPRRRQAATEGPPRHRLPRRHTLAAAECGNNKTEDDEVGPRAQHTTAGVQGHYVNPHTDDDEPRPRDAHADPCPAATAPPFPPSHRPRRTAREAGFPVGSERSLRRRAAARMSPRIRTGPETVPTAHAPPPSAAAATAQRKSDQLPITEQNVFSELCKC